MGLDQEVCQVATAVVTFLARRGYTRIVADWVQRVSMVPVLATTHLVPGWDPARAWETWETWLTSQEMYQDVRTEMAQSRVY